jgi:replicative DNA helicase
MAGASHAVAGDDFAAGSPRATRDAVLGRRPKWYQKKKERKRSHTPIIYDPNVRAFIQEKFPHFSLFTFHFSLKKRRAGISGTARVYFSSQYVRFFIFSFVIFC